MAEPAPQPPPAAAAPPPLAAAAAAVADDDDASTTTALCHASVRLLLEAGERLRLPQETIATAAVVFHRFFAERSLCEYEVTGKLSTILTTCLFLAAKVEEHPRRLRDVINSVHLVRALGALDSPVALGREEWEAAGVLRLDREYWALKERIVDTEQLVLRVLGFDIETFQPPRLLCNYARSLRCRPLTVECAWRVLADALFSPPCCRGDRPPQALAAAALHLAQRSLASTTAALKNDNGTKRTMEQGGEAVGEDEEEVRCDAAMWRVLGAEARDVEACLADLLALYEQGVVDTARLLPAMVAAPSTLPGNGGKDKGGGGGMEAMASAVSS